MMNIFKDIYYKHEQLKKRIHSFRMPLSPLGQKLMGFIYCMIPIISGYYIMQFAISKSEENLKSLKIHKNKEKDILEQNKALGILLDKHNNQNKSININK